MTDESREANPGGLEFRVRKDSALDGIDARQREMLDAEQGRARLVRPWYAWSVSYGPLFRTRAQAEAAKPERPADGREVKLLRQYRFEDDGSFCGIAEPVR